MFLCVLYEVVCKSRPLLDARSGSVSLLSVTREGTFAEPSRSVSFVSLFLSVCVLSVLHFKLCVVCFCVFKRCAILRSVSPTAGRGQLLSRRYCTHSVWLFSCAS